MSKSNSVIVGRYAQALTATLWLGLLLGVSFVATPIKFAAPTLTLPVALDVGRVTFGLFSKIEWVMAALMAITLLTRPRPISAFLFTLLVGLLAIQFFWLLPILDARIAAVIAGTPQPSTSHHLTYVMIEIAKASLLLSLTILSLWQPIKNGARGTSSAERPSSTPEASATVSEGGL